MSEPIKIKNRLLVKLGAALKALDSSSDDKKPYEYDIDTYWKIVRNQEEVNRANAILTLAKKGVLKKVGLLDGEKITPENEEKARAWMSECEELDEQDSDVNISKILVQTLLGKKFRIPMSVMADLMPILDTKGMAGEQKEDES